jgi:hypothetical protein
MSPDAGPLILPIYLALEKGDEYPFKYCEHQERLENNHLLLQDHGKLEVSKALDHSIQNPTLESEEEWQAKNMLLSNGVLIVARSRGQKYAA